MELFEKLFGQLLLFVYHCFDRIVINGYLSGLSRPEPSIITWASRAPRARTSATSFETVTDAT